MNGEYEAGNYFSSFVGFFPADAPQLVLFVKLDSPKGAYFGGVTAAPVARGIIEGILAARQNLLDGPALLRSVRPSAPGLAPERPEAQRARFIPLSTAREPPAAAPITGAAPSDSTLPTGGLRVADLIGLPARIAVGRLHALGFRVHWEGSGEAVTGTVPGPGIQLEQGDTVALRTGRVR
jgi:cell division protein FtsI (penicillin-binding protein 3)